MFGLEQIDPEWLVAIGIASAVMFILSLLIVPIVIVRIPDDYFRRSQRRVQPWVKHHPILRYLLILVKNLLGFILLIMGILMLVLPGQGLLTILFGIALIDFPGKYVLERRIIKIPSVLKSINWIRQKAKRSPLLIN